jgi:hypothetical protein
LDLTPNFLKLNSSFNEQLDQIFSEFSKPEYSVMMNRGKGIFMDFAGSFDEDNLDTEMKWSQFRDWFLFQYNIEKLEVLNKNQTIPTQKSKSGLFAKLFKRTPKIDLAKSDDVAKEVSQTNNKPEIAEADLIPRQIMESEAFRSKLSISTDVMDAILNSNLSVFQHLKSYKDQIKVIDLVTRTKCLIRDNNIQLILEKNDYIQTRVYKLDSMCFLGGSHIIHPPKARKFIDSKVKLLTKEKNKMIKAEGQLKLLDNIFRMYYRALRFRQVEILKIYSDQPLFERKLQVSL